MSDRTVPSPNEPGFRAIGRYALMLAALFALIRLLWLGADPPGYILDEFITDEGWYAQAARDHALFGQWVMDEHNVPLVLCPAHTLALRSSYQLFGVSFWSTRIVGALASVLTVLAVAWGLRREPLAAGMGALVLATQPILFSLARVAYCESLQLLFVTALWLFASDRERRPRCWIAAGAAAGLAVFAKASALYAPVLALAAPVLTAPAGGRRQALKETAMVAGGLALCALVFLPFLLPFTGLFWIEEGREGSVLWRGDGPPAGLALPLMLGLHHSTGVLPGFWVGLFPLLAAFGVATARLLTSSPTGEGVSAPARLATAWLVLSLGFLCLRKAPATHERYWANLLVPLAALIALAFTRGLAAGSVNRGRRLLATACVALGPVLLVRQAGLALLAHASGEPQSALVRVRIMAPLTLLALALFVALLSRRGLGLRLAGAASVRMVTLAAVLIGAAAIAASMAWRTDTIREASRALGSGPTPQVLTGDLANTLALETPFRAFVHRDLQATHLGTGWVNHDWRALGATHWVSDRPPGQPGSRMPAPAGAVLESSHPVWPDSWGRARLTVYVSALPSGTIQHDEPR